MSSQTLTNTISQTLTFNIITTAMSKKKEQNECMPSLQEQVAALKKTIVGQKGQIGLKCKQVNDLKKCVSELLDEREAKDKIIKGLNSQVSELRIDVGFKQSIINEKTKRVEELSKKIFDYNSLPWYKKMFTFNI